MKRQLRQARHRKTPKARAAKQESNRDYYRRNRERLKVRARTRQLLRGNPEKLERLRRRFRIIGPGEQIPENASLTTRNSCGTKANTRADTAYILEGRYPIPDRPWGWLTACPDLSTLLGLGGKGQNLDVKEFIRDEMLRRFPERYPRPEDLPKEEEILRRNVGPPDRRETEKRVRQARRAQLTPDFSCPNVGFCGYVGPMIPTGKGPYPAEKFLAPEDRKKMGVGPDELLPGVYCPQCRGLVLFPAGADVSRPPGTGNADEYRCICGFLGRPLLDLATDEFTCPDCGLVLGMTIDDRPDSPRKRTNSVA
jgi:hypothetical protein